MKMYFDVYIRPMGEPFFPGMAFDPNMNFLNGWDRLELLDDQLKLTIDGVSKALGDGTQIYDAEKAEFETGTLKVSDSEWTYLRNTYHGTACDVLLLDPNNQNFFVAAFNVRLSVTKILESGQSIVIKIKGKGEKAISEDYSESHLVCVDQTGGTALIRGIIYAVGGTTPITGATVQIQKGATILTDTSDDNTGEYLLIATAGTWTFTVTKSGRTFPTGQTLAVEAAQEYVKDFTALT